MKEVNLVSLYDSFKSLNPEVFIEYKKYNSIELKSKELIDYCVFIEKIKNYNPVITIFNFFYLGFKIPQISKEFDLLRIDENCVVNIEIKKKAESQIILKQLIQNKYYLKFLLRERLMFCYIVDENKVYHLSNDNELIETSILFLIGTLNKQKPTKIEDIKSLFKPSNYLISPFNSTQDFIRGNYFLTSHQEEIKEEIITLFEKENYSIISLSGRAGTGKTLVIYDLVKDLKSLYDYKIIIFHCGLLNEGHYTLNKDYSWNIFPIKDIFNINLLNYDILIFDETQRIFYNQLQFTIDLVKKIN